MSTDTDSLLAQAKCYLCLGVSMAEALQLALLADIVDNGGTGGGSGLVLGPWVEPQLAGWPDKGTLPQEALLSWTNTTGKIQWFQCAVALACQGQAAVCDFIVNGNNTHPNYSPQTNLGDEMDFFFSAILAPGDTVSTIYDADPLNSHRVQNVWYRTLS